MPRNYGKIKVEVWESGSDYRLLSLEAQWAYQMLISQEGVSMIGLLRYAPRKWARLAAGLGEGRVEAIIAELEQSWYVIVDRDAEELLIRSFVKHDEGWRLPNLLTGARLAFRAVESEAIRDYLAQRHPWLLDKSIPKEQIESFERDQPASERTLPLPLITDVRTDVSTDVTTHVATDVTTGGALADVASPAPTPAPSKGRGVGAGSLRATPGQEAALRAVERSANDESGALSVRAECPVCGPLHNVRGFDLAEHLANVHGKDEAEIEAMLESRTQREVA
jgi:hypothetical protein